MRASQSENKNIKIWEMSAKLIDSTTHAGAPRQIDFLGK